MYLNVTPPYEDDTSFFPDFYTTRLVIVLLHIIVSVFLYKSVYCIFNCFRSLFSRFNVVNFRLRNRFYRIFNILKALLVVHVSHI